MKIFAIYDLKSASYKQPFPDLSTVNALRSFSQAVNGSDSLLAQYCDDFCLMELATFDQDTGRITPFESPINLGSARTVLRQPSEQNTLPFNKSVSQ